METTQSALPTRQGRRTSRALVALLILLIAATSAGCRGPDPTERTATVRGADGERTAIIYHPTTARPGAPLVVVMHGANGAAADVRKSLGWDALAERDGFVVAYPDALDKRWNAGFCCRRSDTPEVDDVGFLHELREKLIAEEDVDPRGVYAVGASNGGMLAYAWACSKPDDLAGIAVVSGALTVPCPDPPPISVVAVHGSDDEVVPPGGGLSVGGPGNNLSYPSLDEALAPFLAAASCPPQPEVQDSAGAEVAMWKCPAGRVIIRDIVKGKGHGWPGSGGNSGKSTAPTDPTGYIWFVFSRLRGLDTPAG
ncbi:alpha/beta hydrolase family esterase [Mycolicibacterium wolinskyi]|uniref:alpha/beta hydrolase family esterase n=1 Tax=Mycolicibacterium wolinskyi TaxID=59750 RepID=UPI0039179E47